MREDLVSTWIVIFFRYFENYKKVLKLRTHFLGCTKYLLFEKCQGETMIFSRFWFLVCDVSAEYWNPCLCVFWSSLHLRAVPRHYVRNSLLSSKVADRIQSFIILVWSCVSEIKYVYRKNIKVYMFFKGLIPGVRQFLANNTHLRVKKFFKISP